MTHWVYADADAKLKDKTLTTIQQAYVKPVTLKLQDAGEVARDPNWYLTF